MPEGHTIRRIAIDHGKLLTGRDVEVSSPQGRFGADAERVDGASLERLEAYGKHLFYRWSTGDVGHVHLGLFGKFRVQHSVEPPVPRGEVRMRLRSGDATIDLSGPTACTIGTSAERRAIIARLGPDPLRRDGHAEPMIAKIVRSKRGIGDLLMDQSVIAGVGNVYRAEALFVLGIHPLRPGTDCDPAELEALWAVVRGMLRQGVKDNRIITVSRDELGLPRGRRIPRREATYVYKRDRCIRCGSAIVTIPIANRTCYYCPVDQPH